PLCRGPANVSAEEGRRCSQMERCAQCARHVPSRPGAPLLPHSHHCPGGHVFTHTHTHADTHTHTHTHTHSFSTPTSLVKAGIHTRNPHQHTPSVPLLHW